jgi:RNA polymerase-binding transcription factor DksA
MAEPARKYDPEDIIPEDAVLGPGTYQNVDTGRIIHKSRYGPLPPSGTSKRYVKISDDPTHGMSEEEARQHREDEQASREATSYEHPSGASTVKTGEVVSSGTYRCTRCGNEIEFKDEGHVPPCSVCTNTTWKRE